MSFGLELNYFFPHSEAVTVEHYKLARHFYSLSYVFCPKSMNNFRYLYSSCSFKIVSSLFAFLLL